MARKLIGLCPPSAARELEPLVGALEDAYPVRFELREQHAFHGLDAMVSLMAFDVKAPPCPCLVYSPDECAPSAADYRVSFGGSTAVDARLRGRSLLETDAPSGRIAAADHDEILAIRDGEPVWVRRATGRAAVHFAASPPRAPGRTEPLRDHLRAGRFFALLPLVSFLREVSADDAWVEPPLRGLIMFDDPNLRRPSYGYIDYRKLVSHAQACHYHVAMAMIPMDGRPVHPRAGALFREHASALSLLMHGIRHAHIELTQDLDPPAREALAAKALRQVSEFERRSGIRVSRVMCAPHGEASEPFLSTLLRLGLEAFINDLPLPWTSVEPPTPASRLRGWTGASFVAGGLPVLPRHHFKYSPDDLVLRAFLDHPLVIYGHHDDVADGLEPLAEAADLLNSLGVQWGSASWIASTNFLTRKEGDTLMVRLRSRKIDLSVPPETTAVELEIPLVHGEVEDYEVLLGDALIPVRLSNTTSTVVSFRASPGPLTVELRPHLRLDPRMVRPPGAQPWPVVRRALTEGRDRLKPLLS